MDVDAVEQRAGDAREIAFHAERATYAVVARVAEVAAGTSLRCLFAMSTYELKNRSRPPIRGSSRALATTYGSGGLI